jgi:hypothetical protein
MVVPVSANAPAAGSQFAGWLPATTAFDNPYWPVATYVMPAGAATLKATYAPAGSPLIPDGTYQITSIA